MSIIGIIRSQSMLQYDTVFLPYTTSLFNSQVSLVRTSCYLITPTPALDDGDDIIDLDLQLVRLIEVLQRSHVGRHGLHQELSESHKCRPVVRFLRPALQHDIIDVLGTVLGLLQPFTLLVDLMEDLSGTQELVSVALNADGKRCRAVTVFGT